MTSKESEELFRIIDVAMHRAAAKALLRHKMAGRPIYVWRHGKVTEIPPEEIIVPEIPASNLSPPRLP